MEMKKLDFAETFKDAITIGVKNAPSVIAAVALFLVTIWIPYINIGTFIAITLLPTQLAKGEVINPLASSTASTAVTWVNSLSPWA